MSGPGIVLTERGVDFDRAESERRTEDLGGLSCPGEVARDQDVGDHFVRLRPPCSKALGLQHTERRQPVARAVPADHAPHRHVGLTVADQHQSGRHRSDGRANRPRTSLCSRPDGCHSDRPARAFTFRTNTTGPGPSFRRVAPVATGHRLTIRSIDPDPRIGALIVGAAHLGLPPGRPTSTSPTSCWSTATSTRRRSRNSRRYSSIRSCNTAAGRSRRAGRSR